MNREAFPLRRVINYVDTELCGRPPPFKETRLKGGCGMRLNPD